MKHEQFSFCDMSSQGFPGKRIFFWQRIQGCTTEGWAVRTHQTLQWPHIRSPAVLWRVFPWNVSN